MDSGNLAILKEIENAIDLKDHLISSLPELKAFLPAKTTCTEAALLAFTKLCTNTGHKSSLYQEFDEILARKGKSKKFSVLKERRFCLLGYTAAAVLFHLDDIIELLANTKSNNLLVLACRIYIQNDFILSCFAALSYFTFKVTFPLFQMSIKANQIEIKRLLKLLFEDLQALKLNTLDSYVVSIYLVG
jgi:hypothetical protein